MDEEVRGDEGGEEEEKDEDLNEAERSGGNVAMPSLRQAKQLAPSFGFSQNPSGRSFSLINVCIL